MRCSAVCEVCDVIWWWTKEREGGGLRVSGDTNHKLYRPRPLALTIPVYRRHDDVPYSPSRDGFRCVLRLVRIEWRRSL